MTPSLFDSQSLKTLQRHARIVNSPKKTNVTGGTVPRNGTAGPRGVWWPTGTSNGGTQQMKTVYV
jgi:hypothetical protein